MMAGATENESKLTAHLARFTAWLFQNARPQYHYSLLVLYCAAFYVIAFSAGLAVLGLFGSKDKLDFDLVGCFVGPLAFGGLVAGHVRMLSGVSAGIQNWLVPAVYGGSSFTVFWLINDLRWGTPDPAMGAGAFAIGAGGFLLLDWLMGLKARARTERDAAKAKDESTDVS